MFIDSGPDLIIQVDRNQWHVFRKKNEGIPFFVALKKRKKQSTLKATSLGFCGGDPI